MPAGQGIGREAGMARMAIPDIPDSLVRERTITIAGA